MKMNYIYFALVIAVIAGVVLVRNNTAYTPPETVTKFDAFAQCIGEAGTKFYGAYWCPHCQAQKKLFANSKKIPYIECSLPSGQGQTQVCIDAGIKGYPTWVFGDGSRVDGEQTLEELSTKTGCALPPQ